MNFLHLPLTRTKTFDLATKASFQNCLVAMRPQTTKTDIPSPHDVKQYLHNEFVGHLGELAEEFKVSPERVIRTYSPGAQNIPGDIAITCDAWTADTTSCGFLGVTAHWIHVDSQSERWEMRSAVIGLRGISGDHSGKNLGRYVVGLCDRVGLMGKQASKVCVCCSHTAFSLISCLLSLLALRCYPRQCIF